MFELAEEGPYKLALLQTQAASAKNGLFVSESKNSEKVPWPALIRFAANDALFNIDSVIGVEGHGMMLLYAFPPFSA